MTRAAWCLAGVLIAMVLCVPNRGFGQYRGDAGIFDVSIGGISDCRASRLALRADLDPAHRHFLDSVRSFVESWGRWRRAYNHAEKSSDGAARRREFKLWREVVAEAGRLREAEYAREKFGAPDDPPPLTPPAHIGFHYAAWDFTSAWYKWLSRHIAHTEKRTSDLEALRGDGLLFQESMRLFRVMEEMRPRGNTPWSPAPKPLPR